MDKNINYIYKNMWQQKKKIKIDNNNSNNFIIFYCHKKYLYCLILTYYLFKRKANDYELILIIIF